jgi:hypothetical protein
LWLALSAEEQLRAMRIAFNEQTRRFLKGLRLQAPGLEPYAMTIPDGEKDRADRAELIETSRRGDSQQGGGVRGDAARLYVGPPR